MASKIPLDNVCEKKIETLSSQYDGEIEYVDISSIDNNEKIISNTQIINAKEAPSRAKQLVKIGDVLVSTVRPNLNAVAMIKKESNLILVASTGYCVLRCNGKVDNHYIFYFCQSPYFIDNMVRQATGASYPAVSNFIVKSCLFPAHNLKHQREIASILDKLRDLIFLRKQQLAKLDELVKARFVEMFGDLSINSMGWEFQKLSSLCDVRDGTHDSPEYQNEGYPLLTSKNFSSGIIDFSDCNLICEEDFEMINRRSKVDYGDIIMPMIGTIGHPVIVDTDRPFAIKNVALIKFNNKEISNIFVKTVLDSDYFLNVTTANNRGGTQKFIALGDIRNIPIPIVPKELQIEFADFVKEVDRQKLTIQQSLDKLEVLRKSLMQEYFG